MIFDLNLPQGEVSWWGIPVCEGGSGAGEVLCPVLCSCVCGNPVGVSVNSAVLKGLPGGWAWSIAIEKTVPVELFVDMTNLQPFSEFQLGG